MFLMLGITEGMKEFDFVQTTACKSCGRYGRYNVFMTYTLLSLFFIPCFKWNKQYFVRMSCCGTTYLLDPEVGRRIARGEDVTIGPGDLTEVYGNRYTGGSFYGGPGFGGQGYDGQNYHGQWQDGQGYDGQWYNGQSYDRQGGYGEPGSGRDYGGQRNNGQGYGGPGGGISTWANWKNEVKTCENCGYQTDEDFEFCPKCGRKF